MLGWGGGKQAHKDLVWVLGTYLDKVWEEIHVRGKIRLRWEVFFGFLKFKYKAAQLGARLSLGIIPCLLV